MCNEVRTLAGPPPDSNIYGNKASGLWWLSEHGFSVPQAVLVPSTAKHTGKLTEMISEALGGPSSSCPLIVRSSSGLEDAPSKSAAGQFLSVSNVCSRTELIDAIERVSESGPRERATGTPLIVQRQVGAALAGVLFPTDPVTSTKEISHIEVVAGHAGSLLGGIEGGTLWEVSDSTVVKIHGDMDVEPSLLQKLRSTGREIECLQKRPCDIEFAVDHEKQLWLLQVRPVVNGVYGNTSIEAVGKDQSRVDVDDKIKLRLIAQQLNIPISRAWMLRINAEPTKSDLAIIPKILLNDQMYSYVVLNPPLIDGKVVRQFSYGREAIDRLIYVLNTVAKSHWKCEVIIKEVLNARYTGLAMRDQEGYWIEIAQGHYVPKGFVEVSRFRFNTRGVLISKEVTVQTDSYEVNPLGAVRESISQAVQIDESTLQNALRAFRRVWERIDCVLEFGINAHGMVFLVDYVPSSSKLEIPPSMVRSGIISKGHATGRVVRVDDEMHATVSQNWHAKNVVPNKTTHSEMEGQIIAARRPFISLMEYVGTTAEGKLGFVFEEATLLSHLAIQLRERGIPAIWCDQSHIDHCVNQLVKLDAETSDLLPAERLVIQ